MLASENISYRSRKLGSEVRRARTDGIVAVDEHKYFTSIEISFDVNLVMK